MRFSRASLARGTLWNFLGQGAPLVVAIFAIPPLVQALGTERFGVLVLVWMFIGYFSLFDLGIGRALTQLLSERLAVADEQHVSGLVWTAMLLMLALGIAGAGLLLLAAPVMVHSLLRIPAAFQLEALRALQVLALAIPAVVMTAGLTGVLAAKQRFDAINILRLPMGLYTYLAPWLVVQFSPDLFLISVALATGRAIFLVLHVVAGMRVAPGLRRPRIDAGAIKPLFRFGTWMTVSNIIGPLMVYVDRFVIGMLISMSAVAFYATPYEVVTRLWIVPAAIVAVLFPAFASLHDRDRRHVAELFDRGLRYMVVLMFPLALVIVAFARQGLQLWLGEEFAERSTDVLRWLAVGVFVNSLCQVAFALVQGAGRPDLSAKFHLLQLPLYLGLLWLLLRSHGIEGAAVAWTVRILLDAVMLFMAVRVIIPECRCVVARFWPYASVATGVLCALAMLDNPILATGGFIGVLAFFCVTGWRSLMADDERAWLLGKVNGIFHRR